MGVRLFGVTSQDGHVLDELPGEGSLLQVRDLAAVIGPAPYVATDPDDAAIDLHRRVIDVVFKHRSVLPLPVGTVFRGTHALERWMELHYVSLSDALAYVDDRVAA
ncbi:MAG: GvpL/GvpF family gas vesicle protein, partial [Gemmatimonadaceae bacterium]